MLFDLTNFYFEGRKAGSKMTEASMNRQWRERFENELARINEGIKTKSGTKTYDKVIERTDRAIQKYPSISKYYQIEYVRSVEKPKQFCAGCRHRNWSQRRL